MTVASTALDQAAALLGTALGVTVKRDPIGPDDLDAVDSGMHVGIVVALTEGSSAELDYCIGAPKPYEIEHAAAFEILAAGGTDAARKTRKNAALALASAAIAANRTLNDTVDYAEFDSGDPAFAERFIGYAATLRLTYTAADALG
jgi:hypothetical protein